MLSGPPAALAALDQPVRERAELGLLAEGLRHGDSSVTATERPSEQRSIRSPSCEGHVEQVHVRLVAARERARDHVAPRVLAGGAGVEHAGAHLLLDPGMILRERDERVLAMSGRSGCPRRAPAMATPSAPIEQARRGRGHPAQQELPGHFVLEPAVGQAEGRPQAVGVQAESRHRTGTATRCRCRRPVGLGDEGLDGFDGEARGHLAAGVSAHAVGDEEQAQVWPGAEVVLVVGSAQARVGAGGPGAACTAAAAVSSAACGPSGPPAGASTA